MSKEVKVTSIIRKLYVEDNGKLVEVKEHVNPADYGKDVTIYSKVNVKGDKAGETNYCVAVADFIPKKRAGSKEKMATLAQQLKAEGLSDSEILARLVG